MSEAPKFTKNEFKQLQYLFYFGAFIVLFQVFQYITTNKTAEKHDLLFSKISELVVLTHAVTAESSIIQRAILNITLTKDSLEVLKHKHTISKSEYKINQNLDLISDKIIAHDIYTFEKTKQFVILQLSKKKYTKNYNAYLRMLDKNNIKQASEFRINKLRPLLDNFLKNNNLFLEAIFTDQQILTKKLASDAKKEGFILLIAGNFLLALILVFLVFLLFSEKNKLL